MLNCSFLFLLFPFQNECRFIGNNCLKMNVTCTFQYCFSKIVMSFDTIITFTNLCLNTSNDIYFEVDIYAACMYKLKGNANECFKDVF